MTDLASLYVFSFHRPIIIIIIGIMTGIFVALGV